MFGDRGPKAPPGFVWVRTDGYDTKKPLDQRAYHRIRTGYGEGIRAFNARGGPNVRKLVQKMKEQFDRRRAGWVNALPSRAMKRGPQESETQRRVRNIGRRAMRDLLKGKPYIPPKER